MKTPDEDRFCGCCGDYPVARGEDYYCELCAAVHDGTCDELAERYRDELWDHAEQICMVLSYVQDMHDLNCKIHTAGELEVHPCDCSRDKVVKILEDLL
jgi:hypothetical protein